MATKAPTSQKDKHITFVLSDDEGKIGHLDLPINPEELTRTEPSRVSAVNALGGAWVDSFGRGLSNLTLVGNTGWGSNGRPDGVEKFIELRDDFIHYWHALRENKVSNKKDPNTVELIIIDPLNGGWVGTVVPTTFTLRRSKSNPLLLMYNMAFTVIKESAQAPSSPAALSIDSITNVGASFASLAGSTTKLQELTEKLNGYVDTINQAGKDAIEYVNTVCAPAIQAAKDVIEAAKAAKRVLTAAEQVVVDNAKNVAKIGKTLFDAVGEVKDLPQAGVAALATAKSELSNTFCVLANGFSTAISQPVIDVSVLLGSSNCSSTSGGTPAATGTLASMIKP